MNVTKYRRIPTLKKEDCAEPLNLIIIGAEEVNFSRSAREADYKIVVTVEADSGERFRLALNQSNLEVIASAYGDETDDWAEQEIVCVHDPDVEYDGQRVGGIKVSLPKKRPTRARKDKDEIPFN
jgi:hypothetical protein